MELHRLKQAMLVDMDLSCGNLFDMKKLLGWDEADSFYHIVPVSFSYCFPDIELSGTKTHQPTLSTNEIMPTEQYSMHKINVAGHGELNVYNIDHARGLVNVSSYLTELRCYITVYGK